MKTSMITLLLVVLAVVSKAQVYTIPWAQVQPDWVFPLWFENGDGQKDTIYIGYDENAHGYLLQENNPDTIFGELCQPFNNSNFYVTFSGAYSCNIQGAKKCCIGIFDFLGDSILYCNISVANHVYPLKIKWDLNVFRSSALPFNTCSNCPNALGLIYDDFAYSAPTNVQCLSIGYEIAFTDSSLETCNLVSDSLVLDQVVFPQTIGLQYIKIKKWRADSLFLIRTDFARNNFCIYPNPFQNYLLIEGAHSISQARLLNVLGNVLYEKKFISNNQQDKKIEGLDKLISGAYILQLINGNEIINKLIIKN